MLSKQETDTNQNVESLKIILLKHPLEIITGNNGANPIYTRFRKKLESECTVKDSKHVGSRTTWLSDWTVQSSTCWFEENGDKHYQVLNECMEKQRELRAATKTCRNNYSTVI